MNFGPMSSVATALAMVNHKDNYVRYIPRHLLLDDKDVARNLTVIWNPFDQSRKLNSKG